MGSLNWVRQAYVNSEMRKVDTFNALGEDTDTREYNIPVTPVPGLTLLGVQLQSQTAIDFAAGEAPIGGATAITLGIRQCELRDGNNKGSHFETGGMMISTQMRCLRGFPIQDVLPTAQGAGTLTANWNLFIPGALKGPGIFKFRTGLISSAYVADVTAIRVSGTIYAVYARTEDMRYNVIVRECNVASMTSGNVTSNLSGHDGLNLHGMLFRGTDGTGTEELNNVEYTDGGYSKVVDAQTVFATDQMELQFIPRQVGTFYIDMPGRVYTRNGALFIVPSFLIPISPNVACIQGL